MRLTQVSVDVGGEEFDFDLKLGQVRALQEKTGFGPAVLAHRLQTGQWNVDDFRETLKQGWIGGGKTPTEAEALCKRLVDERPAKESLLPATFILLSWINGAPQQGKKKAAKSQTERKTAPAVSPSPPSTEPVLQSDSPLEK